MQSVVKRITVDEILSPDLIRFEVCLLKEGVEVFFDEAKNWESRSDELIHKISFKRKLPQLDASWDKLKEGQVFLLGEFEAVATGAEPDCFKVAPGQVKSLRIDNLKAFKDRVKRVYSDLLTRR